MTQRLTRQSLLAPLAIPTRIPRACIVAKWMQCRGLENIAQQPPTVAIPLRKHLKDEAKRKKTEARSRVSKGSRDGTCDARSGEWELTVGIEIHAELNTAQKLFSSAATASSDGNDKPNTNVALFDAAIPGSQPCFTVATLLPALRAAIALRCTVQRECGWDRKHYFHWDQPNGYQITQYYRPFAKNGAISLEADDGVPVGDLKGKTRIEIGIAQIQMEQDTAKTTHHPPSTYHIDLNRSGHPLIEIITLPQIHSPQTAAAVVRKIQRILKSSDSCTMGMEQGGLRADVNVSVRRRGRPGMSSYRGVSGLGQRTEIKNLSSLAAVEHAIVAERDRQINVLENGGIIESETRGWTLGSIETTRLRGKEGEVDYRYKPDADLLPLLIGPDLVEHIRTTLPELPDESIERVQRVYGLSRKDAKTIVNLDDGDRLEFLEETVELMLARVADQQKTDVGRMVSNWVLHEIGGLLTTSGSEWDKIPFAASDLADLLINLQQRQITSRAAKQLLAILWGSSGRDNRPSVDQLIDKNGLRTTQLAREEYIKLAKQVMAENPAMVEAVRERGQKGKMMWFVGQMVRRSCNGSTVDPAEAQEVVQMLFRT